MLGRSPGPPLSSSGEGSLRCAIGSSGSLAARAAILPEEEHGSDHAYERDEQREELEQEHVFKCGREPCV